METSNLHQADGVPVINTRPQRRKSVGRWLTLAVAVLLVGAASVFVIMQKSTSDSAQAVANATVAITADGFSPQTIRIKKGESITWVNKGAASHHVVADPFPSGDSLPSLNSDGPLAQDEAYTKTFEDSGTFNYHDQLNPASFHGTVIVE
ncbi:MAG TPA: cupredoxin domain-containing protein [Candidatus Saccharimonadales bacterium]